MGLAATGAARVEGAPRPPAQAGRGKPRPSSSPILLLGALLFLVSLFYVWTRMEVVKATYALSSIQRQLEDEHRYAQKLRLEVEALEAPDRVASVASQKLGMQAPGEGRVVVVRP